MKKRGVAAQEVTYVRPMYYTTAAPEEIIDRYTKWVGSPGTIDCNGIWIPKALFKKKNTPIKPEPNKILVPLRRSFYTGRRYCTTHALRMGDRVIHLYRTDERFRESRKRASGVRNMTKEQWAAIRKWQAHKYNTGRRNRTADAYLKRGTAGYAAIDGVVAIKKIPKERECAPWVEPVIQTGVQIG